jgi:hypothetical protein
LTSSALGDRVPDYVVDEIDHVVDKTKRTGREESLAFCRKPDRDRIFVGGYAAGDAGSVEQTVCEEKFGESVHVGSLHTHPVDRNGPGVIPSEDDLTLAIAESNEENRRVTDCITNHKAPYMLCYTPKQVPSDQKLDDYDWALDKMDGSKEDIQEADAFYRDNVAKDFDFTFYDMKRSVFGNKNKGNIVRNPDPKVVVRSAILDGRGWVRKRVSDLELGPYCALVQDFTVPNDDRVGQECKNYLKTKKFLFGLIKY